MGKKEKLFLFLGGFFITNTILAEFIGVKIFSMEKTFGYNPIEMHILGIPVSLTYTAGVLIWPIVFITSDIINEYYGKRGVKLLSYFAAILISYAFAVLYIAIHTAPVDWWVTSSPNKSVPDMNAAYFVIFGQGMNIIVGSITAFLIGQLVDVGVFHFIRKKTDTKYLWLRATGSTLVSQFIDSFVVLFIAFYIGQNWTLQQVFEVGLNNYIYKFVLAILLTPLIYLAHKIIDNYLGKETAHSLMEEASKN